MIKIALVLVTVAIAASVSRLVGGNRTAMPAGASHHIPDHLEITDFAQLSARWLMVVFSSAKCEACREVLDSVERITRDDLFTTTVELEQDPDLHRRYQIDAVPTTLIADPTGLVRRSFLGPVSVDALDSALGEATDSYRSGDI